MMAASTIVAGADVAEHAGANPRGAGDRRCQSWVIRRGAGVSTDLLVFAAVLAGEDVLVSPASVIFAQIIPDVRTGLIQQTAGNM